MRRWAKSLIRYQKLLSENVARKPSDTWLLAPRKCHTEPVPSDPHIPGKEELEVPYVIGIVDSVGVRARRRKCCKP